MKASNLIKTLVASLLLTSAFAVGSARADSGYVSVSFGDFGGGHMHHRHFDRDGHDNHPRYGAPGGHHIDHIQAEQRDRIRQGIHSGELTPREAARLIGEQREIERMQQAFMMDSRLSPHERQRLLAELDDASHHIWHQKHDAQDRDDYRPHWHGYR